MSSHPPLSVADVDDDAYDMTAKSGFEEPGARELARESRLASTAWVPLREYLRWEQGETTPADILRAEIDRLGYLPATDDEVRSFEGKMSKSKEALAERARNAMAPLLNASKLLGFTAPESLIPHLEPPRLPKIEIPDLESLHNPVFDVVEQPTVSNQLLEKLVEQVVTTEQAQLRRDGDQVQRAAQLFAWTKAIAVIAALTLVTTVVGILLTAFQW